jgi:hypothetical protein
VSNDSGSRLLAEMNSGAVMCPLASDLAARLMWAPALSRIPRVSSIKKSLADMSVQLDTHVPNTPMHVSKLLDTRVIMSLQDVRPGGAVNACKACRYSETTV